TGLGGGEGGKARLAAQRTRGAGEEDRARTARQHFARDFAADEEAAQRVFAPELLEAFARQIKEGVEAISAGIVQGERQVAVLVGGGSNALGVVLDAGIGDERFDVATGAFDFMDDLIELALRASDDDDAKTLARETP